MSKIATILTACAVIAGASAYGLYRYTDAGHGCTGCQIGHAAATVEPCCEGHDHDGASCEVMSPCCSAKARAAELAKASCCAKGEACCEKGAPCCDDATMAVAGPGALVKVSATAKKAACCADVCAECAAIGCQSCDRCAICCGAAAAAAAGVQAGVK